MKALLILLIPSILHAKPFVGMSAGRYNGTDELSSTFIGGGEIGLETKGTLLFGSMDFVQNEMRSGLDPKGTVTLIPLQIGIGGRMRAKNGLSVRISWSVGAVLSSFQIGKELEDRNRWNPEKIEVDVKDGICYQIKGGIESNLNKRLSVGFEIGYLIYETDLLMTRTLKNDDLTKPDFVYEWTSPVDFSSIVGKIVVRFK